MMKTLIAAASAALFLVTGRADATCTQVSGTGEATDGVCAESPLGLCASGTIAGSFEGTYVGAFQSLAPSPTLMQPLRLVFTVNSTITTSTGTLLQTESGFLVLNDTLGATACVAGCVTASSVDACLAGCVATHGRTTFTQNMIPYAGTGAYSSIVDGLIVASGSGAYTSGVSTIEYAGQMCDASH